MCEIRWLVKENGTRVLQYGDDEYKVNGRGVTQFIKTNWLDVPVVKEDDEQDK